MIKQKLHLLDPRHPDNCQRCERLNALMFDDVFYADLPSYEYFGADGQMTYRPLGKYGLVIWPRGWGKRYGGLYPRFNVYKKYRAAWEFIDHSRYYEPGNQIVTKWVNK